MVNKSLAIILILLAFFLTFLIKKEPEENKADQTKEASQSKTITQPELVRLIKKDLAGGSNLKVIKIREFNISCLKNSCAAYLRSAPKEIVLVTEKNKDQAYQKILDYINQ